MAIIFASGAPSTAARLTRTILPSLISGLLCILAGAGTVTLWLVASSVNFGTFLPDWLDGYFGAEYTNTIIRPILVFINQPIVNTILLLLGWGLLGIIVYGLVETAVRTHQTWRSARNNVQIPAPGVVLYPGKQEFLGVFLVRGLVVAAIGIAVFFVLPQLAQTIGSLAPRIVTGEVDFAGNLPRLALQAGLWALFAHFWVVAVRLLLLRPRIY